MPRITRLTPRSLRVSIQQRPRIPPPQRRPLVSSALLLLCSIQQRPRIPLASSALLLLVPEAVHEEGEEAEEGAGVMAMAGVDGEAKERTWPQLRILLGDQAVRPNQVRKSCMKLTLLRRKLIRKQFREHVVDVSMKRKNCSPPFPMIKVCIRRSLSLYRLC
jgi:hypothetical protein